MVFGCQSRYDALTGKVSISDRSTQSDILTVPQVGPSGADLAVSNRQLIRLVNHQPVGHSGRARAYTELDQIREVRLYK